MFQNKKKLIAGILFIFMLIPFAASAALVPCATSANPEPCTLCHFIIGFHGLVEFGMKLVAIAAIVGLFFAGIFYIISIGDETMMTRAKGFIKASLIGFAVVFGAWLIVTMTMWVLSAKDSNSDGIPDFGVASTGSWNKFTCDPKSSAPTSSSALNNNSPVTVTADNCCVVRPGVCSRAKEASDCPTGATYQEKECSNINECKLETCGNNDMGFCSYSGYAVTLVCPTGYSALSGGKDCPTAAKCCVKSLPSLSAGEVCQVNESVKGVCKAECDWQFGAEEKATQSSEYPQCGLGLKCCVKK